MLREGRSCEFGKSKVRACKRRCDRCTVPLEARAESSRPSIPHASCMAAGRAAMIAARIACGGCDDEGEDPVLRRIRRMLCVPCCSNAKDGGLAAVSGLRDDVDLAWNASGGQDRSAT